MELFDNHKQSLEKILDTFGCPKPHPDDLIRFYDHSDCPCNITKIGQGNHYFISWKDGKVRPRMTILKRKNKHDFYCYKHYTLYHRTFAAGEHCCHSFHLFDNHKYDSTLYDERNGGY